MRNFPPPRALFASRAQFIRIKQTLSCVFGPISAKCCWPATLFYMWIDPEFSLNRRSFLRVSAGGLGSLALSHLLATEARAVETPHFALRTPHSTGSPLSPKTPHHKGRAKSVICLFQHGGP